MKSEKEMQLERDSLMVEREKIELETARFGLDREKENLKNETKYFKKELVECARRNVELLLNLERSGHVDEKDIKDSIKDYLKVMKNVVELNK